MSGAAQIGALSIKLADAALVARERRDDVHAIFFAIKAAETLALAKALGWKPDTSALTQAQRAETTPDPGASSQPAESAGAQLLRGE